LFLIKKNIKTKISFTRIRSIECWCYNNTKWIKSRLTPAVFTKQ
jgi:hypothetical protein